MASKAWAFFKRDLLIDLSYKLSFAFGAVHILITVAAFFFLASVLDAPTMQGYDSFAFILTGLAVNAYMTTCLVCFTYVVRESQVSGTLKAVLVTPTSPGQFLAFSSLYPLARATLDAAIYGAVGLTLGVSLAGVNPLPALLVFAASVLAFSSIGMISATFILIFKRGDPLLWLFGSGSWLLGGVMYPTDVLPRGLQQLAEVLPITHALRGLRAALLADASVTAVVPELTVLATFVVVGLPASIGIFEFGLWQAKATGTLGHQ